MASNSPLSDHITTPQVSESPSRGKRARSQTPTPDDDDSKENIPSSTEPPKKIPLFRRFKIPITNPPEFTDEYLALLQSRAIQEAAQAAQAAQAAHVETLAVPADFLQDLIEARWQALMQPLCHHHHHQCDGPSPNMTANNGQRDIKIGGERLQNACICCWRDICIVSPSWW
ncbi:hypothetical protein M405DRAFT_868855 [Rhizopogon salebrosus TDB-379]|nr:hypothetical protein M405DRAFT_868855 [Rhizopogon salebrosus TDB-379]